MISNEQFVLCSFFPTRRSGEDGGMNTKTNESDLFKNVQAVRKGNYFMRKEREKEKRVREKEKKRITAERKRQMMNITCFKKSKYEEDIQPSAENKNGTI